MQYLISVINDTDGLATPDEDAAIDAFNDRLKAESHWVFAGGLGSPSAATVIDNRGGEAMFTDGPFLESKEYIVGFWIIEAPDRRTRRPLPCLQRGVPGDRPRHRSRTSRPDRRGDPAHSPAPCPHAGRR
jgi:hypothetical protein